MPLNLASNGQVEKSLTTSVLVYATPGTGKTMLVKTLPHKKILFFAFEKKYRKLDECIPDGKEITYINFFDWKDIESNLTELIELIKSHDVIVLDSLTEMRDVFISAVGRQKVLGGKEVAGHEKTMLYYGYLSAKLLGFIDWIKSFNKDLYCIATMLENKSMKQMAPNLSDKLTITIAGKINYVLPLAKGMDRERFFPISSPEYFTRLEDEDGIMDKAKDGKLPADLSLLFGKQDEV